MSRELTQIEAMRIIRTVGAAGQPPALGTKYFTDGFDTILKLLDEDYFSSYLKQGGSAFKVVVGHYGGGKTHFLYLLRDLGWTHDFVVSYVSLTPEETPFHRLDLVYRSVVSGVVAPPGTESPGGLIGMLKTTVARWRDKVPDATPEVLRTLAADATRDMENLNFQRAMRRALAAVVEGGEDEETTAAVMAQWLSGQGFDRNLHGEHGILGPIDRSSAFSCLRSFARFVRQAGYSGLIMLFDEAERAPSMSGKQKEFMLSNLRELIDESSRGTLPGALTAYAIPDHRFFDGKTGVYEAVKQRIASMFDFYNPSGVRIDLEHLVPDQPRHLRSIGAKLWRVFELAYGVQLAEASANRAVSLLADAALEAKFADISFRRLFVQSAVRAFEQLRRGGDVVLDERWASGLVDHYVGGGAA